MARLGLSSPWVIFYRELEELFIDDPEVRVIFNELENEVTIWVDNEKKAYALSQLLPDKKEFGNVTLKITVIPGNGVMNADSSDSFEVLFKSVFEGNPVVSYIKTVNGVFTNNITYIVFVNTVVQYFNDSLGDVNGNCSTLYQEIARNIFGDVMGIFFCTDVPLHEAQSFGKPLGEWP